jgi:hypothetical protein
MVKSAAPNMIFDFNLVDFRRTRTQWIYHVDHPTRLEFIDIRSSRRENAAWDETWALSPDATTRKGPKNPRPVTRLLTFFEHGKQTGFFR